MGPLNPWWPKLELKIKLYPAQSIESEIRDRFRHSRCLNDHIDPFYMIGLFWDHFGTIFGPFWDHFGTISGPFWDYFGTILGPLWDHLWTILGQFWDHYEVYFGTIWDPSYFDLWGHILTFADLF